MKIAWVTPYQKSSMIGKFSRLVTEAFDSRGHSITMVSSDREPLSDYHPPPPGVELLPWSFFELYPTAADAYDLMVFNIGDHYDRHFGSIRLLDRYPGICIMHDFCLVNLFLGWSESGGNRPLAHSVVSSLYGEEVADQFWNRLGRSDFIDWAAAHAPMTEWIAGKALAAIAHAPFYLKRLMDSCAGPVKVVAPAYDAANPFPVTSSESGFVQVLIVGMINRIKEVEAVIGAIAASPILGTGCRYNIVGKIESPARNALQSLINDLQLKEMVHLQGHVDDAELSKRLAEADIVYCLPLPALAGISEVSTSSIEAMLYGKAVLVIDMSYYSSIPSDLIVKVRPNDLEDLRHQLEILVVEAEARNGLGQRAKDWAEVEFAPDYYVQRVEPLLAAALQERPLVDAMRQIAVTLRVLGVQPGDPLAQRIESEFQTLFCRGAEKGENEISAKG